MLIYTQQGSQISGILLLTWANTCKFHALLWLALASVGALISADTLIKFVCVIYIFVAPFDLAGSAEDVTVAISSRLLGFFVILSPI